MQMQYGGLNPLDGPGYWQGLSASPRPSAGGGFYQDASGRQWVEVNGELQPVQAGDHDGQFGHYGQTQRPEKEDREAIRALLRAKRQEEYEARQAKIRIDLESGASAMEAYGLGGLVPLSGLGVDGSTGARAAGLNPTGAVLPATPDALRVKSMPSGQASAAPAATPAGGVGDMMGALKPAGGNKYSYKAPSWASK